MTTVKIIHLNTDVSSPNCRNKEPFGIDTDGFESVFNLGQHRELSFNSNC